MPKPEWTPSRPPLELLRRGGEAVRLDVEDFDLAGDHPMALGAARSQSDPVTLPPPVKVSLRSRRGSKPVAPEAGPLFVDFDRAGKGGCGGPADRSPSTGSSGICLLVSARDR